MSTFITRARQATPEPVAKRKVTAPAPRPMRAPQESRPHGATMARRGGSGFSGVLGRLHDKDPALMAYLRRNPDEARAILADLDRLLRVM